jgi:surfactin synthase thioesterase subunit
MNLALELGRLSRREVGMADLVRFPTVAAQAKALETRTLGTGDGRVVRDRFHIEWVSIPAPHPTRVALVHPGGYSQESDVWLMGALMSGLARDTSLMVAQGNINNRRIKPPKAWLELVDPLAQGIAELERPLLVGVCVGALVVAELAERLKAAGRTDTELVLIDPWTPGLGRTAAGEAQGRMPRRIRRYYALFKSRNYPEALTPAHVILSGDDSQFEGRRRYWSARVSSEACLHVLPGDHVSFLRELRHETARALASIVRSDA